MLVTDCYSAYDAQPARGQTEMPWPSDPDCAGIGEGRACQIYGWRYFTDIQTWVTRGCRAHRRRGGSQAETWPRKRRGCVRNSNGWKRREAIDHDKGAPLEQVARYGTEWLTFLDNPRAAHRQSGRTTAEAVGHSSQKSHLAIADLGWDAHRTARLMTVKETAKQHGHRVLEFFYRLAVDPDSVRAATSLQRPVIPSTALLGPRPRCGTWTMLQRRDASTVGCAAGADSTGGTREAADYFFCRTIACDIWHCPRGFGKSALLRAS